MHLDNNNGGLFKAATIRVFTVKLPFEHPGGIYETCIFSGRESDVVEVPPRRGMAGIDALIRSQDHGGTALFEAINAINRTVPYDRLIVITDEQAGAYSFGNNGSMPDPKAIGYLINVASNKNGVGYGKWRHIDGWSENVIRWITGVENDA